MGYDAPIVALTAFADEINRKECIESGMSDFMAKPIRRPALKHVLKTYCPPPAIQEVDDEGGSASSPKIAQSEMKGDDKKDKGEAVALPSTPASASASTTTAVESSPLLSPGSEAAPPLSTDKEIKRMA